MEKKQHMHKNIHPAIIIAGRRYKYKARYMLPGKYWRVNSNAIQRAKNLKTQELVMQQWVNHMKMCYSFDAECNHARPNYIFVALVLWLTMWQPVCQIALGVQHLEQASNDTTFKFHGTEMSHRDAERTHCDVTHKCNLSTSYLGMNISNYAIWASKRCLPISARRDVKNRTTSGTYPRTILEAIWAGKQQGISETGETLKSFIGNPICIFGTHVEPARSPKGIDPCGRSPADQGSTNTLKQHLLHDKIQIVPARCFRCKHLVIVGPVCGVSDFFSVEMKHFLEAADTTDFAIRDG